MLTSSVVITTKNRVNELEVALHSALDQKSLDEVIVIDDGSDDGTSAMVTEKFPSVILHQNPASIGCIASRNIAARIATADIIFSIDDDAEFSSDDIVCSILPLFEASPLVAAVAIPYREPYKENIVRQVPPAIDGLWSTWGFIGTAHAIRRSVFLELGGYDESMVHQGEETDFSLCCLKRNYLILLGHSKEILHYESPKRDNLRMAYYGPRNTIYLLYKHCPSLLLIPALVYYLAQLVFYSQNISAASKRSYLMGILDGLFSFRHLRSRSALSLTSYRHYLKLRRQHCLAVL